MVARNRHHFLHMNYKEFLQEIDKVVMGIGDVADRLDISIDEVKSWKFRNNVPQEAVDLINFEKENMIDE
jgi:hypothetical protein